MTVRKTPSRHLSELRNNEHAAAVSNNKLEEAQVTWAPSPGIELDWLSSTIQFKLKHFFTDRLNLFSPDLLNVCSCDARQLSIAPSRERRPRVKGHRKR
jgi:hypothetical protein